ncbi:MAG: AraC family transcriptional regulator [Acetatifactor sp.]|nr:AraC family transcriptional regulator [Acetatifactor sp.]
MDAFFELARDEDSSFCCYESENNACNPHFHSNIEIAFVLEGELSVTISGQTRLLKAGDLSVATGFEVHNYATPRRSRIQLVIIPVSMVGRFMSLARNQVFSTPFLEKCDRTADIREAVLHLADYNDTTDSMIVKGYLYVILGHLVEELGLSEYGNRQGDIGPVRDILMYIEDHYLDDITESKTAQEFGYNKYYFSRLFNQTVGCGFLHYVNTIRARHAASLIHNTDMPLTQICYASGFHNTRTFARAFKELYNVSAQDYRRGNVPYSDMDNEAIKFRALRNGNPHTK